MCEAAATSSLPPAGFTIFGATLYSRIGFHADLNWEWYVAVVCSRRASLSTQDDCCEGIDLGIDALGQACEAPRGPHGPER